MDYLKKQPITINDGSQDIFSSIEREVEPLIKLQETQDNQMSIWLKRREHDKIKAFLSENSNYTFGFDYNVSENTEARKCRNASFTLGWHFPKDPELSLLVFKHSPNFSETLKGLFYGHGPQSSREHLNVFLDNIQEPKINVLDVAGYYQWSLGKKNVTDQEYTLVMDFLKRRGNANDNFHLSLMMGDYEQAGKLANEPGVDPHQKNKFGSPFFHEAAYKWPETSDNTVKWKKLCQIFKSNASFDPNIMNGGDYAGTVLHSLIFRKKLNFALEYVKAFSGHSLDLNLKNFKGWAPVHGLLRDSKDIMNVFAVSENTLNAEQLALKATVGELFLMMAKSGMNLDLKSGKKDSGKTAKKIAAEKEGGSALLSIATENLLREISERVRAEAGFSIDSASSPKSKRRI